MFSQEAKEHKHESEEEEFNPIVLVGFGPTLELSENLIGVNGRAYYGVNEQLCFGAEASFYPFKEIEEEEELSILDLNLNVHYIFELSHKIGVYPLSGINYTIETERFFEERESEEGVGLNYGAGLHYRVGDVFFFGEFKGIIGKLNDEFITIGAILSIPL